MVVVYWIHRTDHTNPSVEGYVGVSKNLRIRLQDHQREKWFCKDNFVVDIIQSFENEEEAYLYEETLRPVCNLGWNINKGGTRPPVNTRVGVPLPKWSEEKKEQHSNTMKQCYANGTMKHWTKYYSVEEVSAKIASGDPGKSRRGKPAATRTPVVETTQGTIFTSQKEAAQLLNIRQGDIANCLSGRQKSVKGYNFKYVER
jgi:predicted GIY-YIG superfamily endonuclease